MIKKARHYQVICDAPKCDQGLTVPVVRHDQDIKRSLKQSLIKAGWGLGSLATTICPKCNKPKEKLEFDPKDEKKLSENAPTVKNADITHLVKEEADEVVKALKEKHGASGAITEKVA